MRVTEVDWNRLESTSRGRGTASLRLYPDAQHDLFLALRRPGDQRMLTLRTDADSAEKAIGGAARLPRTRGMSLQLIATGDDRCELQVVLTDTEFREVFNPLVTDIAGTVRTAGDSIMALLAAVDRFEHWRHLLESVADDGLSQDTRRGLYGEIAVLRDHLLPVVPADAAVRAWTGPTGANQDFQFMKGAIEVKTTSAKQPQTLVVSNERELDDRGCDVLLLAHMSIDERRGGIGESLNTIVDSVSAALGGPGARSLFNDMLLCVGYLPHHRHLYDEPRYTVRGRQFWHVAGDFPRITESDLRPGVGDCCYRIVTTGLDGYVVPETDLPRIIGGSFG